MDEQVIQARQNLQNSFIEFTNNLKIYATAKVNFEKSKLQTVKNAALKKVNNIKLNIENGVKKVRKDTLKFKAGVKQKASSMFAKIGQAKNEAIKKIKSGLSNIDQKIVGTFTKVGIIATNGAVATVRMVNGIIDYSSDQIARYRANRAERIRMKQERIAQRKSEASIKRAEAEQRRVEHQNAIESAKVLKQEMRRQDIEKFKKKFTDPIAQFQANQYEKKLAKEEVITQKEREASIRRAEVEQRRVEHQNAIESAKILKQEMRRQDIENVKKAVLNIKNGVVQKASTAKSKMCTLNKKVLNALNPHNLDIKIANAFVNAQLLISSGLAKASNGLNNLVEYQKEMIAEYEKRKNEKAQAKAEKLEQLKQEQEVHRQELAAQKEERMRKKEEAKRAREEKFASTMLQFKEGVIQKVQSGVGRLGSAKKAIIENIKTQKDNIDQKISNIITDAKVFAAGTVGAGIIKYNQVKNYTHEQIQALKDWNTMKKEERLHKKAERDNAKAAEREELLARNRELRTRLEAEKQRLQQEIDKIFGQSEPVVTAREI